MPITKIEPNIVNAGADFTFNNVTATGNLSSLNANLGNLAQANYFSGSGANLTNLPAGNISGQVGNALISGTVYTSSQPNITSVGTLTGLTSTGTINLTGASNVALGPVGNVRITGGSNGQYLQTDGSGILSWSTVAGGSTSNISNGNSNVNIPSSNGNVNISAVGNANILVITGTGANITGTLSVTGNANVGNLGATGIYATTLDGVLTTAAQPNITSIGTLSSLSVTGNANTGNLGTTNFIATGTGSFGANVNLNSFNITNLATPNASTDAATKQYVDDVAQGLNVHDAAAAATPDTLANVTSGTITYNNGSSGVGANLTTTGSFNLIDGVNVQTSGTRILVKNEANAVHNGIYTWSNATVITRATDYNSVPEVEAGDFVFVTGGTVYDNTGWVQTSTVTAIGTPGNNIEFTQFSGAGTYQAGTGLTLTGSTFSVNASQTQVTSVGTLTGLAVNGDITAANITANTGVFTGNGSGLSSIAGANVSGQVGNALISGTVYTAAQPNITSVGTLTSLAVTGNITSGNANLGNNVSANFFTGNGSLLTGITVSAGNTIVNGNSNVNIPSANGNVNISAVGNANILVITGTGANITGALDVTGNLSAGNIVTTGAGGGNITGANLISANYFTGTLTTAAQPNITSVGTLTTLGVNGTVTAVAFTANSGVFTGNGNGLSSLVGANVTGQVGNALVAGTVYTAAQPNITSVGTLTSLAITGNITSGNANLGNLVTANFFTGNGSLLTGITVSAGNTILNGNSNVFVTANGNVTTSVAGNANILVITGTGANISGTLNVTGNATVGNIVTSGSGGNVSNVNVISANTFVASGNVTAGNASLGNTTTANFFIGSGNNLSNIQGSNVTGAVGLATFATTANAVAGANVSGQVTFAGTANSVAGANVSGQVTFAATANSVAGANVTGEVTFAATANSVAGANVSGQVANALVSGTVYTNAQPNITTVGSLLGLTVSNATGVVNFTTTANIALGPESNVHITGGSNGQYLQTDGSGNLSWSTVSTSPSNISNGNSNVSISTANGNITMSAVGNANIVTVTGTGANISGTLNTTGNVAFTGANISLGNVGNVRITGGTANYVLSTDGAGNLDWVAQSGGNAANVTVDNFTGNGVQTIFTLSTTPIGINQTSVNYNGATVLRTDYTLANANITFSSAPANGSYIEVTTINLTSGGGGGITAQDLLSPFLLMGA
jgi:hypothetical protein